MMRRPSGKTLWSVLICALVGVSAAAQAAGPQPPCGVRGAHPSTAPNADPAIALWHDTDLEQNEWQPPPCTGWPASSRSKLLIGLSGNFSFAGTIDQLLARVAAISTLRKVKYWSTTDKKWRPLANDASALNSPDPTARRPDFAASELKRGAKLYYWEDDSRLGVIVTRLSVLERTADRAVLATENTTPVRSFLITMFPPGALQTTLFIQRTEPNVWSLYLLSRSLDSTSMLAGGHDDSYVNRAVAIFRQIAGIQTDQEPPARR